MYLSKYIRRCDFMDNMNTMDFNQKIDVSLRASLEATPVERNASDDLSTGSSSDGFWDLFVLYTGSPQTLQNEFPSSSFTFLLGNYAIVKISEDDIPSLAAFPQVIYIERPRQLFFEIVSARQASCLSAIQENSSYGLTGKGILISVIDSGIDYAHPDFCNPDKTTRLVALWDQTILADPSAGRFAPAGYSQGTLFSPEQINAALQADTFEQRMELVPSTDVTGHGTHVAGIAAGNGRARAASVLCSICFINSITLFSSHCCGLWGSVRSPSSSGRYCNRNDARILEYSVWYVSSDELTSVYPSSLTT